MKYPLSFLVFAAWLAGCGPVVDTNDTSTSGSGGAGGSSGVGGFGPAPSARCVPLTKPSVDMLPLCGSGDAPCQILEEELLVVPPAYRNDAPALSLDASCRPRILFSSAVNEYKGFYAVRKAAGDWEVNPTPFDSATAGLVSITPDVPVALVNDGAFGASLWSFTAEGWSLVDHVPEEGTNLARGFAIGQTGELFAGFRGPGDELLFGRHGSSWSVEMLGGTPFPFPVVVSPEGAPHLIAWEAVNGAWELHWHAPPLAHEVVMPLGSGTLQADSYRLVLGATGADEANPQGKPHVLALRQLSDFTFELVYVTREGTNAWTVTPIEQVPQGVTVYPLGVVTDEASSVRLFYSRFEIGAPTTGQFVVAAPHPGGIAQAVVTEGFSAFGATFDRDGAGRLHVALYELGISSDVGIRYLVLSP
ncbi:hypothetical protein [Polyangium jinanense]|uniref:Lipoprotein n=1 Tax=Polyangium jinanense TaxID=2829994 RepID=A0A9X3X9R1_9BACT|nr:hypothetical protein [Polyangium jinanense]MDC3957537.1 hypothetical protein [Polyangium jinanense]MDC3984973.1 hypothetical protein [Polyangium jinanense]